MDLSTSYLGLKLKNPLVAASSPLSRGVDSAKRLEDAGVAAIVMHSLFEEQINHEQGELDHFLTATRESYAEAITYFPEPQEYANVSGDEYLAQIRALKRSLGIPVIASLNGVSQGGWMRYAKLMQEAGADALELNVYYIATQAALTSERVEQMYLDDIKAVKAAVTIPVAMKLGPYFSAFANFAQRLDKAGADGLVLFNRFFGPDIDLDSLSVVPQLSLSTAWEMRLPLRWIAVLSGNIKASLAATTGVKGSRELIKLILAGADVAMVASALLEKGPDHARQMIAELRHWMEEHSYASVSQMRGSMNYRSVAEPSAYERANYMKALNSWK